MATLRQWLAANNAAILEAIESDTLLELIIPVMLQHNRHSSLTSLSDRNILPLIIQAWMNGDTFTAILAAMKTADIRIGGNSRLPKIEDAVAICEGGLAYEGAMIVATIADLCETQEDLIRMLSCYCIGNSRMDCLQRHL